MNRKVRANKKRNKKKRMVIDPKQLDQTMRDNILMMTLEMASKITGLPRELVFESYKIGKAMGLIDEQGQQALSFLCSGNDRRTLH